MICFNDRGEPFTLVGMLVVMRIIVLLLSIEGPLH